MGRTNSLSARAMAGDTESEQSSSDADDVEERSLSESEAEESIFSESVVSTSVDMKEKKPIKISLGKVCKVCKKPGHEAGFKGATYIDCPLKPCFLCKMPGHTTMTCPHRVAGGGTIPARKKSYKILEYVYQRQLNPSSPITKTARVIPDEVSCAVIKYHSRRVTCLEFHPANEHILLSGDKKGQIGVWDFHKVHERLMYQHIHSCIVNNMRFCPSDNARVFSASSDGTISCFDVETGISSLLLDTNPGGWQGPKNWKMLYGMDVNSDKGLVLAADNFGYLYLLDMRSSSTVGGPILIHKRGCKVVGIHCNSVQPELFLSCGNDHLARMWDIRQLQDAASLCDLVHQRVVNSAYFSPSTGSKILTTSQDNRIRVWDSIYGNLELPSREIVHSHDFNRHLTPFKAEWDPKDPTESLVVIGRYISENYNEIALHPIDFIDASTGDLVAQVMDPNITTISSVNKLHPTDDVLATGSSRSLYIWRPKQTLEHDLNEEKKIIYCRTSEKNSKSNGYGSDGDSDDDGDVKSKLKNRKSRKASSKSLHTPKKHPS